MKVKDCSNKKKNALPSSKLLKPKKFKTSLKSSGDIKKEPNESNKLKLLGQNIKETLASQSIDNLEFTLKKKSPKLKKSLENVEKPMKRSDASVINKKESKKSEKGHISSLFDFVKSQERLTNKSKDRGAKNSNKNNGTSTKGKLEVRHSLKSRKAKKKPVENKQVNLGLSRTNYEDLDQMNDKSAVDKCKLKVSKVAPVTEGLLKLVNGTNSSNKMEILDVGEAVFLQVECIKIPICPTKQLRFKMPHPLIDDSSDILLITTDLKGHKIYPDKAVEHYEELLADLEINFINKIMPFRMIKKEYSQYEMRRKLVDQFDVILADSRIIKSLPSILGKFVLYKRKMPIPVNLTIGKNKLKNHLKDAVCKTQMTVKSNGHCSLVQVGHTKMNANEIASNIVEVAKSLENMYPGGWRNIRCLTVKTAKSTSLPVYLSLLSPNEVKIPVEERRRPKPVEDELSTMLGYNVVVTHDGNVILKKVEEEVKIDNSKDDEILEEAKKYLESSKTVRYDDSSDEEKNEEKQGSDSEDDGEAITEAMEKKLMYKYEKSKTKKNKMQDVEEDEEEEEDDDNESEEESEIVPLTGKKRKPKGTKELKGPPAKKASSSLDTKKKSKQIDKPTDGKKTASPGLRKPQTRGVRGGKKTKLSKDQRKALIKRKKAGKK